MSWTGGSACALRNWYSGVASGPLTSPWSQLVQSYDSFATPHATYLLGNGEGHAVVGLAELEDLVVRTGLLGLELRVSGRFNLCLTRRRDTTRTHLVAGLAHDLKLVRILVRQSLQVLVLRVQAAAGRDVDNEQVLVGVVGELELALGRLELASTLSITSQLQFEGTTAGKGGLTEYE